MLADQPISTAKDDLLGRKGFARQVASAMLACPADKRGSFVIGLYGEWGSGKTSILNMVAEAFYRRKVAGQPPRTAPIVVRFSPWQYPAAEMLAAQFLLAVADGLQQPENGKKLQKAGKAMRQFADALQGCIVGEKPAAGPGGRAQKPKKQKLPKDVVQKQAKVCKCLRKQKKKIYILMDDIDRLSARRIRYVLQLVGTVAAFPRTVYLLAMDQDVVQNALTGELKADGGLYLEKFVQAQFTVPAADSGRMQAILGAYIAAWRQAQPDLNFDPAYFAEIKPFLDKYITGIRDVYRFINTFRFQYQALGNEVNFCDLLAVTAMQLHTPKALPWMQRHRDDLLRGGGLEFAGANTAQKQRLKRDHRQMILELGEPGDKSLLQLMGHMFPRYGANVLDVYDGEADRRYVRMRRICCEEFFDLYFTLSPDALAITRADIMRSVRELDAAALRAFADGLNPVRRGAYIAQLQHYLDDITAERLPMFFDEMLWLSRLPEEKTPSDKPFQRSLFQECCTAALRMLAEMGADMRLQSLTRAARDADEHTLPILTLLLTRIRRRSPDTEAVVVDDEALRGIGRQLLKKICAFAEGGNWLAAAHPLPVLEFWKQEDAAAFTPYFARLKQDDGNMARLVSCLIHRFDRGANMEYQYGDMNGSHAFSGDFTRAEALAAILRLQGTAAFQALPEDVRLDCVAFSLMDEQTTRVSHRVVLDAYPVWEFR